MTRPTSNPPSAEAPAKPAPTASPPAAAEEMLCTLCGLRACWTEPEGSRS